MPSPTDAGPRELAAATSVTDPMRVAKAFRDAVDSIASWSHSKLAELQRALVVHDVTAPVRASSAPDRDEAQRSLEFTQYWYGFRLKRLRALADKHGLTREHCEIMANGTEENAPPDAERLFNLLKHERDHLAEFKAYVHKRLDEAGVPPDPEPAENAKHGCRIEGRLNQVLGPPKRIAPPGGFVGKCPRCTRVPHIEIAAGQVIGNCAQCWLGEGVRVAFVPIDEVVDG